MNRSMRLGFVSLLGLSLLSLAACGGGGGGGGGGGALVAPSNVAAVPSMRSAAATWDAVAGADSYRLYLAADSTISSGNWTSLPEGRQVLAIPDASYTLLGLEPGGQYWFVVAAVRNGVEGPLSAPGTVTLAPDTPKWILADGGPSSVTFSWTQPRGALRYDLYVGREDRITPDNWQTVVDGQMISDAQPGLVIDGVPNGTELFAVVVAWNDIGRSPTSNTAKAAACGRGTFTLGDVLGTSGDATTSALADFDGDAVPDLVTLSASVGAIEIFPGVGDGTFAAPMLVDASAWGVNLTAMAVADLDGDGLADLALRVNGGTYSGMPEVWTLIGWGDGTFWLSEAEPLATADGALAVANLRGLGFPADLVVSDPNLGVVGVLLGEGLGGFEPVVWYAAPAGVSTLVVGDFDGDDLQDVVASDPVAMNVLFFKGDGLGALADAVASPSWVVAQRMQAVDANLDGTLDVLIYDPTGSDVIVLRGVGDGTFLVGGSIATGSSATAVSVADVDGDGLLDIVVSVADEETLRVYLATSANTYAPHFALPTSATDGAADTLLLEDLNGDGALDIVVTHPGDEHVVVAYGSPV